METSQAEVLRLLADCISSRSPISDIQTVLNAVDDPNASVVNGLRLVHYAAYEDYTEVISLLVVLGASVDSQDNTGYTPLHIAAKHGHEAVGALLLKFGAKVNFLEFGDTYDKTTINPLTLAIEHEHVTFAVMLLQHGANVNQSYFMGSEINLIDFDNAQCLEVLLQHGANPNSYNRGGWTVLQKACKAGNTDIVKMMIKYGANLDKTCHPKLEAKVALHYAVMCGNVEITKLLLEAGASTRKPAHFRCAPLEYAITQGKLECVSILLEFGADPNEVNEDLCTPLLIACTTPDVKNQYEIIKLLMDNGANPNYSSPVYNFKSPCLTPIVEYLAFHMVYDASIVRLLLKYGARVNMRRPTQMYKIKDPSGILFQVRKVKRDEDMFDMLIEASGCFNQEEVDGDRSGLTRRQKAILAEECEHPRSLAHSCRLFIRMVLKLPLPRNIDVLPIPKYHKHFLMFENPDCVNKTSRQEPNSNPD